MPITKKQILAVLSNDVCSAQCLDTPQDRARVADQIMQFISSHVCLDAFSSLPLTGDDQQRLSGQIAEGYTSGILDDEDYRISWELHANKFKH